MNKFSITTVVNKLLTENKNVLILDTCCILDVIRCIQRQNLNILKTTIEIINILDKKQNNFVIVLPSLIDSEWSSNYETVKAETKSHIDKVDMAHKNLIQVIEIIYNTVIEDTLFSKYKLEDILYYSSEMLLNLSICLESIEECKIGAVNRVMQQIPPAAQGKDSTKDCIIFEETLLISNLLRDKGFSKKIVFASSNTKEYFKDREPIPQIKTELKKSNIELVNSLNHGFHLVK